MYTDYFGFRDQPFNVTLDPQLFYTNPVYQRAYNTLLYGIRERDGLIVLTGEVGTGKTAMLHRVMKRLEEAGRCALFYYTALDFKDLLSSLCVDLGLPRRDDERLQKLRAIEEFLVAQQGKGWTTALLIDEAQNLEEAVLEDIRLLSNLRTGGKALLPIVLVGQPEFEEKLTCPSLQQLRQRVALYCQLDRLNAREIAPFILHRLRAAGCERHDLFTPEALQRITLYAQGIPRQINIICDNALLLAYSASQKTVSAAMIKAVARDLCLQETRAPARKKSRDQDAALDLRRQETVVLSQRVTTTLTLQRAATSEEEENSQAGVASPPRRRPKRRTWVGAGLGAFALLSFMFFQHNPPERAAVVSERAEPPSDQGPAQTNAPEIAQPVTSPEFGPAETMRSESETVRSAERQEAQQAENEQPPKDKHEPAAEDQYKTVTFALAERQEVAPGQDAERRAPEAEPQAEKALQRKTREETRQQKEEVQRLAGLVTRAERQGEALRQAKDQLAEEVARTAGELPKSGEEAPLLTEAVERAAALLAHTGQQEMALRQAKDRLAGEIGKTTPAQPSGREGARQQAGASKARETGRQIAGLLERAKQQETALHQTAARLQEGAVEQVKMRLQEEARRRTEEEERRRQKAARLTIEEPRVLPDKTTLLERAAQGDVAGVTALLAAGVPPNATDETGRTALMYAAQSGHTAIVRVLLNRGAEVNAKNAEGETALMYATREGHTATVRALLEERAEVGATDNAGESALMVAASRGDSRMAILLQKRLCHEISGESSKRFGPACRRLFRIKE